MAGGLAAAWDAGMARGIDYAWKQHIADLAIRQENREQYKFESDIAKMRAKARLQAFESGQVADMAGGGQPGQVTAPAPQIKQQPAQQGAQQPILAIGAEAVQQAGQAAGVQQPAPGTVPAQEPAGVFPAIIGDQGVQPARPVDPATSAGTSISETVANPGLGMTATNDNLLAGQQPVMPQGQFPGQNVNQVGNQYVGTQTSTLGQTHRIPVTRERGGTVAAGGGAAGPGGGGGQMLPGTEIGADAMPATSPTMYAPAELVLDEAPQIRLAPAAVPTEGTPGAVDIAAHDTAQQINQQFAQQQAQDANRNNVYVTNMAAFAREYQSIANLAATGEVTFDIDEFAETFNAMTGVYQRVMISNGSISNLDAIALSNGWTPDGKGGFTRSDPEQQVDHSFGISYAQAAAAEAMINRGKNGNRIPEDFLRRNPWMLNFPNIFQLTNGNALNVNEDGVLLSASFNAAVEGRLKVVTNEVTRRAMLANQVRADRDEQAALDRQAALDLRERQAATRAAEGIDRRLRLSAELSDETAEQMATEWNTSHPNYQRDAADFQRRQYEIRQPEEIKREDRQAAQEARQAYSTQMAQQREIWRDENAAQAQAFRMALQAARPIGTRRTSTGRQAVDSTSYYAVQEPMQRYVETLTPWLETSSNGTLTGNLRPEAPEFSRQSWPLVKDAVTTYLMRDGGRGNMAIPTPANAAVLNQIRERMARALPNSVFAQAPARAAAAPASGTPDLFSMSDAELERIARGGQ